MSDVHILAIDLAKNEVLWRYQHPERHFPFYASAAVAGDTVVIAGRDKIVHALEAGTGKARWTVPTRARIDASPVVLGDRVFVGGESGVLYALDLATGKVRWQFETGSGIAASATLARGRLVLGTVDGTVYCLGQKRKAS